MSEKKGGPSAPAPSKRAPSRVAASKAEPSKPAPAKPALSKAGPAKPASAKPAAPKAAPTGDAPAAKPCPICGKPQVERYRPFCSKRCADIDLNRWLTGAYAIPVVEEEDEDGDTPGSGGERD